MRHPAQPASYVAHLQDTARVEYAEREGVQDSFAFLNQAQVSMLDHSAIEHVIADRAWARDRSRLPGVPSPALGLGSGSLERHPCVVVERVAA
jgi:hypothetical protein